MQLNGRAPKIVIFVTYAKLCHQISTFPLHNNWKILELPVDNAVKCKVRTMMQFSRVRVAGLLSIHYQLCDTYGPNIMSVYTRRIFDVAIMAHTSQLVALSTGSKVFQLLCSSKVAVHCYIQIRSFTYLSHLTPSKTNKLEYRGMLICISTWIDESNYFIYNDQINSLLHHFPHICALQSFYIEVQ